MGLCQTWWPPSEYRWRPPQPTRRPNMLQSLVDFRWVTSLVAAVTKPRREPRWNLLECPKLTNRSQALVGQSSPYCEDVWKRYCCLTNIFPIVDTCLICEDTARPSCAMVRRWRSFDDFCVLYFSASRVQRISDLHSKFALRPHHVEVW